MGGCHSHQVTVASTTLWISELHYLSSLTECKVTCTSWVYTLGCCICSYHRGTPSDRQWGVVFCLKVAETRSPEGFCGSCHYSLMSMVYLPPALANYRTLARERRQIISSNLSYPSGLASSHIQSDQCSLEHSQAWNALTFPTLFYIQEIQVKIERF